MYVQKKTRKENDKINIKKQLGEKNLTTIPAELVNGETYRVSHSQVMAMSMPGQLSQVYSIRAVDDAYHDSVATIESIEEDSVLFTESDGNQFMISLDGIHELELKVGDRCIVSHTDVMTKSMPGMYTEVDRIQVILE